MSNLVINFNKAINNVCPIELNGIEIGNITINRDKQRKVIIVFDVYLNPIHRGNDYFPDTIKIVEEIAKNEGLEFIIAQWIVPEKIDFYLKRGFRKFTEVEQKYFCTSAQSNEGEEKNLIKELN